MWTDVGSEGIQQPTAVRFEAPLHRDVMGGGVSQWQHDSGVFYRVHGSQMCLSALPPTGWTSRSILAGHTINEEKGECPRHVLFRG